MRKTIMLMIAALLIAAGTASAADNYAIDPAHSSVNFTVRHLGLSKVHGNFTDFTGTISYDPRDVTKSAVKVTIKTASINTGNETRDNHLRSPDFFDAVKYPELTFASEKITKSKDGFVAQGTLTMHGVSKKVELPFTLAGPAKGMQGEMRLAAEAQITLNRQDYGVSWNKALDAGGVVVGNDVAVEISVEAVQSVESPKQ